jgi:hypothetical protein
MSTAVAGQTIGLKLALNGTPEDATIARRKTGSGGDIGAAAIHGDFEMGNGDYLEVWVTNEGATNAVTIEELYVFAVGMPMFT